MISNKEDFLNSYNRQWESFSLPNRLQNSYQVINCLKETGGKETYLLSDTQHHLYILKTGTAQHIPLMQQEYNILLHLETAKESFYPQCIDFWIEDDTGYLLRSHIKGTSLAKYLENKGCLSTEEILHISLQICCIIEHLHQQQPPIIHRDIKPENFIISKDSNRLYLIDFDTARQFHPDKSRDTQLMGTPSHAAPEQFGFYQSDFRTDIYGIGKTILYLATKDTEDTDDITDTLPKPLCKIIRRCISFSPDKRYSSVKVLFRDLKHYQQQLTFFTSPTFHRSAVAIFLLGLILCALGITLIYSTMQQQTTLSSNQTTTDNNLSLRDQASPSKYNLFQYQESLDNILLAYFEDDYETMIEETEQLMTNLYANEALSEIEAEDYSTYEYLPNHFWQREPPHLIRTLLVYRSNIMEQQLGNYTEVRPYIVSSLNAFFYNPDLFEGTPNIVSYATCPQENQATYYEQALIDYIAILNSSFDSLYGYETPTEKGYSDE